MCRQCCLLRVLTICVSVLLPAGASAERLPIKSYTTADGLAHNAVNKIVRDSRGFLWFATYDGLSRFDGYGFTNFSVEHGLPHRRVTDLLETRSGELWVATFGGLVRFRPGGEQWEQIVGVNDPDGARAMFAVAGPDDEDPRARAVLVVIEASDGSIWCGTRKGLFRLERTGGRFALRHIDLGFPRDFAEQQHVNALLEDRDGTLWAATPSGLYRRWRTGTTARYSKREGLPDEHLHDLLAARDGGIWVASRYAGFFRVTAPAGAGRLTVAGHFTHEDGFPTSWIARLWESSDGRFWAATNLGLVEFPSAPRRGNASFVTYARKHGLSHQELTALAEDPGGNLWIGTGSSGAMKLARHGFTTYALPDGIATAFEVFEDAAGALYVHAAVPGRWTAARGGVLDAGGDHVLQRFGRFDGRRFEWFMPGPPFYWGWVPERATVRTRAGEWWFSGAAGLYRFPATARLADIRRARPKRIYTPKDGLPAAQVFRIFADSNDDVWFSTISDANGLFRWDHVTETLHDMAAVPGFPPVRDELPRAFGEDAAGNIWIGTNNGVARYRNGQFTFFTPADGLPAGSIVDIHADARGDLWLASSRSGLVLIGDPAADRPRFKRFTAAEGLSGNGLEAITSDLHGRIYVATGRGIDRLDPETGRVKHFTVEDGLSPGTVLTAFRDGEGVLWFGTQNGLSRFVPDSPQRSMPSAIVITAMMVGGRPRPISAVGETALDLGELPPDRNQLQIEFASLRFAAGERLRYQYRLDGADMDWTAPMGRRSVSLASLSPGRYRFLVRAVNADELISAEPAVVSFHVLPLFWQRWWFLSLTAFVSVGAAVALHRYRLTRSLELERVRTRIATDLHDDIGANLTRIAILSEVARQPRRARTSQIDAPLSSIATIARESVAAMSDIVWAIRPQGDTLHDMVSRMRNHAEEIFESRDIHLVLDLPDGARGVRLGLDIRRDLYLIFKEAVNNAARHSRCSAVSIALHTEGARLVLDVTDNGIGFDPAVEGDGNGLANMRSRATRLNGSLSVIATPGAGTSISLSMPIRERRPAARRPTLTGS